MPPQLRHGKKDDHANNMKRLEDMGAHLKARKDDGNLSDNSDCSNEQDSNSGPLDPDSEFCIDPDSSDESGSSLEDKDEDQEWNSVSPSLLRTSVNSENDGSEEE
jgi:hypothetical protein